MAPFTFQLMVEGLPLFFVFMVRNSSKPKEKSKHYFQLFLTQRFGLFKPPWGEVTPHPEG